MGNLFDTILSDFKAKETPEAILSVSDDQDLIRIALAWPKILIEQMDDPPQVSEHWGDVLRWNWLWQCITYRKHDLERAVGAIFELDKKVNMLIANRILYPDGEVHSYVLRYLRDRVVRLFDAKPRSRSKSDSK